jgi:hypothetical protein
LTLSIKICDLSFNCLLGMSQGVQTRSTARAEADKQKARLSRRRGIIVNPHKRTPRELTPAPPPSAEKKTPPPPERSQEDVDYFLGTFSDKKLPPVFSPPISITPFQSPLSDPVAWDGTPKDNPLGDEPSTQDIYSAVSNEKPSEEETENKHRDKEDDLPPKLSPMTDPKTPSGPNRSPPPPPSATPRTPMHPKRSPPAPPSQGHSVVRRILGDEKTPAPALKQSPPFSRGGKMPPPPPASASKGLPPSPTKIGDVPEELKTQEELEENEHMSFADFSGLFANSLERAAARALARPSSNTAQGFVGNRNVEGGDVLNSSATGTNKGRNRGAVPLEERKGDAFVEAKQTHNSSFDTLRPLFPIAPPNGVIPSKREQVLSDLLFTEFSEVAPGNGLGVNNKMFIMENLRDAKIVYREPLAEPRKYDGPSDLPTPPPVQFQNEISRRDRRMFNAQEIGLQATGVLLEQRVGCGSLNTLADDVGQLQWVSDKGLKRRAESVLEPTILTPKSWERVKLLPGVQYALKHPRRLFDALRSPERFDPNIAMSGGPTLSKPSALAVYQFPITTQ